MHSILVAALFLQTSAATREQRVLDLLSDVQHQGSYRYPSAVFEWTKPPLGSEPTLVYHLYDLTCGNADTGTFDDVRARLLALELCRIYDLDVAADQRPDSGPTSVVLDGVDRAARIGFELRGRGNPEEFGQALAESDDDALDEDEFHSLTALGYRLHVADVAQYRAYGDGFTPTLAYLAGIVRFLNDVTSCEDVDLRGLLFEREATWNWPPDLPAGMHTYGNPGELYLLVERPGTVILQCGGLADFGPAPERNFWHVGEDPARGPEQREITGSTSGAPSVLLLPAEAIYGSSEPRDLSDFRLQVRQQHGREELVHESRSFAAFLPRSFDLAQPFEVELTLPARKYVLYGPLRIGAAPRE